MLEMDSTTFHVLNYMLDRNLASITVDEATKSLILTLSGNSFDDELKIMLPEGFDQKSKCRLD